MNSNTNTTKHLVFSGVRVAVHPWFLVAFVLLFIPGV
jgi:hypothetical protein